MKEKMKSKDDSIFKSVLFAFMILIMHILLIGGIGVLIFFFYGIMNYMVWILAGVACLVASGGYWFYRRVKSDGEEIKGMVGESILKGKTVEVSFLGGMASFKIGDSSVNPATRQLPLNQHRQLAAPEPQSVKALTELSRLYEKKLITLEEYNKAKHDIFKDNTD